MSDLIAYSEASYVESLYVANGDARSGAAVVSTVCRVEVGGQRGALGSGTVSASAQLVALGARGQSSAGVISAGAQLVALGARASSSAGTVTAGAQLVAYGLRATSGAGVLSASAQLSALGASSLGEPVADVTPGGWLPSAGLDLFAMLDSTDPDDTTYIYAETPTVSRLQLDTVALPGLFTRGLTYRAGGESGGLAVRLYQGATLVGTRTHATLASEYTQYQMLLDADEKALLTSGADLYVELEALAA